MIPLSDGNLPVIPGQPTQLSPKWAQYPWVALVTPLWGMRRSGEFVPVSRVLGGGANIGANSLGVSGVAVKNSVYQQAYGAWVATPLDHAGYTGEMTDFVLAISSGVDAVSYDYACGSFAGNGVGIFLKHTGNGGRIGAYASGTTIDGNDALVYGEPVFLTYTRAYPTQWHSVYRDGVLKRNVSVANGTVGSAGGGQGPAFGLGNLGNQAFSSLAPCLISGRIAKELTQIEVQELLHALRTGTFFDTGDTEDIVYFDVAAGGGGGTTHTASYDESFSLSDTLSSVATFGCILNETMTLTDQEQAPTTYPATFASIFSLIDDYTSAIGSTTLTGIYDESISLGDSVIATMTTLATYVESMPITDSFGAVATYIATLQDSISLQDDVVQDGAILADVIYSISLSESVSSLAQFVSSYVESLTLDSTFAAAATLGTTVEETMSLQATFAATIPGTGGTVSETTFIWC